MHMIATASSIPIDTWVTAPWDEFLRLSDAPSHIVKKCEIIAFEITAIGLSRRIQISQVLPGLAFDLLAATLKRSREADQSTTMAWLMGQINHVIN